MRRFLNARAYFICTVARRTVGGFFSGKTADQGTHQHGALATALQATAFCVHHSMTTRYWPSRSNGGHLGLAKEHTVLQGLGWEARIASENKLNTRLLASDKAAAHAAWLADISRNHACQLRHTPGDGPLPRALPVGTGGAFVPAYDTPPQPRRARSTKLQGWPSRSLRSPRLALACAM